MYFYSVLSSSVCLLSFALFAGQLACCLFAIDACFVHARSPRVFAQADGSCLLLRRFTFLCVLHALYTRAFVDRTFVQADGSKTDAS